jgi:hypothetical protein
MSPQALRQAFPAAGGIAASRSLVEHAHRTSHRGPRDREGDRL